MIKDKDRLIFGNLRECIDRTARIQICDHNTGYYEDYRCIDDVSHAYDSRKVFGIGLVNSEYRSPEVVNTGRYAYAIEVRLL